MPDIAETTFEMISGMTPELRPGAFVFVTLVEPAIVARLWPDSISAFREDEGMSLILPVVAAEAEGLDVSHPMRCITLNVYSSLEGVGLTAAVSAALGAAGIPCNMVAAYHHDHVFVPSGQCDRALQVLLALQAGAT